MDISMYKIEDLEFEIKVLVSLNDKEQNTYYSYIDIDKDKLKRFMENTVFVGKPSEFGIKKDIEMYIDEVFENVIEVNEPINLVTEVEDDWGEVVDINVCELEWDWLFSIDITDLKYKLLQQ